MKTNPFAVIASFLKFANKGKALAATVFAFCAGGRRIEQEFHNRKEYKIIADDRCAARRYWETRGTSFGPSKFFGSNPDFTIYHPNKPNM